MGLVLAPGRARGEGRQAGLTRDALTNVEKAAQRPGDLEVPRGLQHARALRSGDDLREVVATWGRAILRPVGRGLACFNTLRSSASGCRVIAHWDRL
jgi:hypothetical protein